MKVLLVTPQMSSGGAETVVYDLASGLARHGHAVAVASSGGRLADELAAKGVEVYEIPSLAGKRPIQVLRAVPSLARLLRSGRYDVVNAHAYLTALEVWIGRFLGGSRPPMVFTLHLQESEGLYRVMARTMRATATKVVTVCRSTRERLEAGGLPPAMSEVIYNGVDVAGFPARTASSPGLGAATLRVGVVARLVERKGHRFLLQAMAQLRDDPVCPDFVLDIVGDGPGREELERLTAKLGLTTSVRFHGDTDDVLAVLAKLDVFVLPSTYEAFPVSLLEAMSCGVAILATGVDGVPELVEDGVNGVLVRPGRAEALAEALKGLVMDRDRRETLALAGAAHVRERFTLEHMIKGYENLYLSVAGADSSAVQR